MEAMFCSQCQETAKNTGCTVKGVCGKTADVSNLQDLLIYVLKGISIQNEALRAVHKSSRQADRFITNGLFVTITNANFDRQRHLDIIREAVALRQQLEKQVADEKIECPHAELYDTAWESDLSDAHQDEFALKVGILSTEDEDLRSLRQLVVLGLKGMAAYVEHAFNLDFEDDEVYSFMQVALLKTLMPLPANEMLDLVLETGTFGVKAMALLDKANTTSFGNPEATKVNIGVGKNPGILVSGHDLKDIDELLQQTEGTGIDVYTHSEMLPAHSYPHFKKYKHFVGNYGSSWFHQVDEFGPFNGPILFTTNCIVPPKPNNTYKDRVYTTGASGFEGFPHIPDRKDGKPKDFSAIIEHAKRCQPPQELESGTVTGGFAHHQVLSLADKVVEAVKSGAIKKFFVMGGCDGRQRSRNYYTEFAQKLPKDTVILTAGCAKYRYNKLPLGDIGGIPRVLDAGQCNDSYSLAVIAMKLQEVFGLDDINKLPIVFNIAWYEQKAVIVLLALLSLGVKNIHLGPTLPGFLSPNVAKILVENFGIASIGKVDEDIDTLVYDKQADAVLSE